MKVCTYGKEEIEKIMVPEPGVLRLNMFSSGIKTRVHAPSRNFKVLHRTLSAQILNVSMFSLLFHNCVFVMCCHHDNYWYGLMFLAQPSVCTCEKYLLKTNSESRRIWCDLRPEYSQWISWSHSVGNLNLWLWKKGSIWSSLKLNTAWVWTWLTVFHIHFLMPYNSLQPVSLPVTEREGVQLRHAKHFNIHPPLPLSPSSQRATTENSLDHIVSITVLNRQNCCN